MTDDPAGPVAVGAAAFRTDLPGVPGAVEALADELAHRVLPAVDEALRVAGGARADVAIEWQGSFADRSHAVLDELTVRTEEARAELTGIVHRLRAYAGSLRAAQDGLAALRDDARRAGLLADGVVVAAPPGRECELVPYYRRAEGLYARAAGAASGLERSGGDLPGLTWLMLSPGAATTAAQGRWSRGADRLRARAAGLGPGDEARRLGDRADALVARGAGLARAVNGAMTPLGVLVDRAAGESWEQAVVSQGAGAAAGAATGALAAGGAAALATSWSGPLALGVGFAVGSAVALGADAAVDAGYERARRRGTPAGLAERCGGPGGRRGRDAADTTYG